MRLKEQITPPPSFQDFQTKKNDVKIVASIFIISISSISCQQIDKDATPLSIVMLGDSQIKQIQGGYSGIPYSWSQLLSIDRVYNQGYNGYTLEEIYKGKDQNSPLKNTTELYPSIVYLMAGTNECLNNGWFEESTCSIAVLYLDSIYQRLNDNNIQMSFILPVPFTRSIDSIINEGFVLNDRIDIIRSYLQKYCLNHDIECIDLRDDLCYVDPVQNKWFLDDNLSIDGIHFNLDGYRLLGKPIIKSIKKNLIK